MSKSKTSNKVKIRSITVAAVLAALSLVLMLTVRFPLFPSAAFYEMEFSDVPLLVCSALLGPVYSIAALFIVCLVQALTVSASSGFIGFFMHFVSSGLMIFVIWIYREKVKGLKGIVLSSLAGIAIMTFIMIPMNMWLVREFLGISAFGFVQSFLLVCVGFNLIKSTINITIFNLISPKLKKEFMKMIGKDTSEKSEE